MYTLPFFKIEKELLIPHPGNSYTLTLDLEKLPDNFTIPTQTLALKNQTIKDCFIIALSSDKDISFQYSALCVLDTTEKTFDELFISFTVINKVIIKDELPDNAATFHLLKPSKSIASNKKEIDNLLEFLKRSERYKDIFQNINLNTKKDSFVLDKLFTYLYPDIDKDAKFFDTDNVKDKLSIIYSLIIEIEIQYTEDKQQFKNTSYPHKVIEVIKKEESRLERMPPSAGDYAATQDYLDYIKSLPWGNYKHTSISVLKIQEHFNNSHYGLEHVKSNIIEYFALEELTGCKTGSALLLDGPPGTGKTTIAKSIAKATGRDFIRISLGGVSDEAEIRGHRRTYVGSRPGRIISAFSKIQSSNPVVLLDELDKVSASKGDPFSALLELLDPEQNTEFLDRYLEVPYDVSKCLFICTSNDKGSLPPALLDRLELISFTDYSKEEKLYIINNYTIPKNIKEYNLFDFQIKFEEELLIYLSERFNLRDINKNISRLLRNQALCLLNKKDRQVITLQDYKQIYRITDNHSTRRIGFAR
jgi:ATP-dependent Lon protease